MQASPVPLSWRIPAEPGTHRSKPTHSSLNQLYINMCVYVCVLSHSVVSPQEAWGPSKRLE